MHFIFGVAGGLLVARALRFALGLTGWKLCVGTVLLISGVGAIHEIMEFISTLILGGEKGMLKLNDPDKFDTQKDLCNDLVGSLVAAVGYAIAARSRSAVSKVMQHKEGAASHQIEPDPLLAKSRL